MRQSEFRTYYEADMQRVPGMRRWEYSTLLLRHLRHAQKDRNKLSRLFHKVVFRVLSKTHNLEIPSACKIGKGLYLGHIYNITFNPKVVIGDNCNIHKGVTIGQENRGKRKGTPIIGNKVWIGVNATVVGKITVGDDVMIAPNAYVNCDVPSHSIAIGNPCKIISRENATEGYINHMA